MKDLKFRAWLKKEKKMVDVLKIDFIYKRIMFSPIEKELNEWSKAGDDYAFTQSANFNEVELMPYMCMNDKNNKEIYVGDVVMIDGHKYVVVDREGIFAKAVDKFRFDFDWEIIRRLIIKDKFNSEIEAIGNIYDNPELLGEKNNE